MDRLNQPNRPRQQGVVSETTYNKPLQQPVRPVRPVRPGQNNNQNTVQNKGNAVVNQQRTQVNNQQRAQVSNQQMTQVNRQQCQVSNQQQVINNQQRTQQQPVQQNLTRGYGYQQTVNQQPNQIAGETDNVSLAGRPKLTRLQREAQGIPSRNIVETQYIGNKALGQQKDYKLSNNNANSFKVNSIKQEGMGFLLLPFSLLVLLAVIVVILLGDVMLSINELKVNTTSLLNSEPISREQFVESVDKNKMLVEIKELGSGITEVMAYKEDYSYEINYITFESIEETQAYYNYIIDTADESESSISSSIVGQNSAESTLISETYNGFMDITYIDNTIIIAIAYDSNKQTEVIEFMNKLGY